MSANRVPPTVLTVLANRDGTTDVQLRLSDGRTGWMRFPDGAWARVDVAELDQALLDRLPATPAIP